MTLATATIKAGGCDCLQALADDVDQCAAAQAALELPAGVLCAPIVFYQLLHYASSRYCLLPCSTQMPCQLYLL
jgi:hypothetical protein